MNGENSALGLAVYQLPIANNSPTSEIEHLFSSSAFFNGGRKRLAQKPSIFLRINVFGNPGYIFQLPLSYSLRVKICLMEANCSSK